MMTEEKTPTETKDENDDIDRESVLRKFQVQTPEMFLWTLIIGLVGATLFVAVSMVTMPFTMFSLFKMGLLPALAIIPTVGAIRGPLAGFVAGYVGYLAHGLVIYGTIVTMTLPAMAYGVMGFIVGLASYDFTNGRSLAKMAVLSMVGFVFTMLLVVVLGLTIEVYATMAAVAFVMLPMLTQGLPSVLLLSPIYVRVWHMIMTRVMPSALV